MVLYDALLSAAAMLTSMGFARRSHPLPVPAAGRREDAGAAARSRWLPFERDTRSVHPPGSLRLRALAATDSASEYVALLSQLSVTQPLTRTRLPTRAHPPLTSTSRWCGHLATHEHTSRWCSLPQLATSLLSAGALRREAGGFRRAASTLRSWSSASPTAASSRASFVMPGPSPSRGWPRWPHRGRGGGQHDADGPRRALVAALCAAVGSRGCERATLNCKASNAPFDRSAA